MNHHSSQPLTSVRRGAFGLKTLDRAVRKLSLAACVAIRCDCLKNAIFINHSDGQDDVVVTVTVTKETVRTCTRLLHARCCAR